MNKEDMILEKLNSIENTVTELKSDVTELKSDVTELKSDVTELKLEVTELKSDVTELKNDVKRIDMTIENRIWPAIQTVAEAHLDTQRRVRNLSVDRTEIDLINIRLNRLETKVGV